jgi:hypothetical protein
VQDLACCVDVFLDLLHGKRDDGVHLDGLGQRVVELGLDLGSEIRFGRRSEIFDEFRFKGKILQDLPKQGVIDG